ncbi:hypothetical protein BDN70DRAFT_887736 [Pholiota conissans]|uniref:F-box domain-containing protein n=1 Tax=Pholiota conissans TaxID=109636 RepID=A0A9P5YQE2_9AGAR|nr:hypothetical protein BDN70DRAFT_887736 [Pholiota conissans]
MSYVCQLSSGKPCSACTELGSFDALNLSSKATFTEERRLLLERINASHDPLSSYLPYELISKIFDIYCEDSGYPALVLSRAMPIPHTTTPMYLASVCTTWRDIAFTTPSLWSSLLIKYSPSWFAYKDLMAAWLDRAKVMPLSIRISLPKNGENAKIPMLPHKIAFLATIGCYAARWQTLNLLMPTSLSRVFLGTSLLIAPILSTLQLHITDKEFQDEPDIVVLVTPRVSTLKISNICLKTVKLDCVNLTSIQISMPSIDEIFEILRRAPGLRELDLTDICEISSTYTVPQNLTHGTLQSLILFPKTFGGSDICIALEHLTFPVLQRFTYNFKRSRIPLDMSIFSDFLQRSGKNITFLSLEQIDFDCISPASLVAVLALIPSLTEVYLECWKLDLLCIEMLELTFNFFGVPNSFLPNLQIFKYRGAKYDMRAWISLTRAFEYLTSALNDRMAFHTNHKDPYNRRGPSPPHTVQFTLVNRFPRDNIIPLPDTAFRSFHKLKEAGLRLKICEETWNKRGTKGELDMLAYFMETAFSEFDDFPVHWFDV